MSALDQLPRAAFDGTEFPVRRCSVKGGLRDHVHEYPKSPGGAIEKLGRKLYTISMEVPFLEVFKTYSNLYPEGLDTLFTAFEQGKTSGLRVPQVGTIKAVCINWDRTLEAKMRSGEVSQLEFREDQSSEFLVENLVNIQAKDLSVVATSMFLFVDELGLGSFFDSLENLIGTFTGFINLLEIYGAIALSKLDSILGIFDFLDTRVPALQDAANEAFIESFLATWRAAVELKSTVLRIESPIVEYRTPTTMAISDVARALYGDSSKSGDLLLINALEDPYRIKAGTLMKVWTRRVET